ncbi:glycosyltransferase [Polymorphobacter sp.]|uniref:glycosyltransferase n=1 Tax=Polymorphobacter sp. TaxID=1909290 RepID=UPI003F709C7B
MTMGSRLPVVVAIPARNEAERIASALMALAGQPHAGRDIAAVFVHANNCTDDTADVARALSLPFALHVIEGEAAHIGQARRTVTDAAAAHLLATGHPDGIVASTDADSRVAPDWLAALLAALRPDVDAVCGAIDLDGPVAPRLAAVRRAEADYAETVARTIAWLDPLAHDPWPNHIWSWGANFAVRARTLVATGGSPLVDLAEDRALHASLLRHDARIRHASSVRVFTSARTDGRAPGGFADLLSGYGADPQALADFHLEPAAVTWRRAARRGVARRQWGNEPGFGTYWAAREAETPALAPQRVRLTDLPAQAALLREWLKAESGRYDSPAHAPGTPRRHAAVSHR